MALRYVREVSKLGVSPLVRHHTWKNEDNLNNNEVLVKHHEMFSTFLDISSSVTIEMTSRELQLIEYEVKKKREAALSDGTTTDHFRGRDRKHGGALVNPGLIKWVSSRLTE